MNILIANYRYFISGGPERYLFAVSDLLKAKGHKVVPFSNTYARNEPTEYARYFLSSPIDEGQVYFRDFKLSPRRIIRLLQRSIYSLEARRKIRVVIQAEGIQLAYLLAIANYISPSIIDGCKDLGLPVVMRLSDFYLVCPAYLYLREGEICEECRNGLYHALRHKCLQGSLLVTAARVLAMYVHRFLHIYDKVDAFVAPSRFTLQEMVEAGFEEKKMHYVPSFIKVENFEPRFEPGDYILYFGRLSKEKGIKYLIEAFEKLHPKTPLLLVGHAHDGEDERLKEYVAQRGLSDVRFLGFKTGDELRRLIQGAMFTVTPSIWYDNTPMTVYESFAYGKPVIGSNLGGIAEQIEDGVDGLLFKPKNVDDLAGKMDYLLQNRHLIPEMGRRAREKVKREYNAERHYEALMEIYQDLL